MIKMWKIFILTISVLLLVVEGIWADNVKVVGEVALVPSIKDGDNSATIRIDLGWSNSWRNCYNYDAVYVFFKYRVSGETDWKHVYLASTGHTVDSDFEYVLSASAAAADKNEGFFVQWKDTESSGKAEIGLALKWNLASNGLNKQLIQESKIIISAQCIEMVCIPRGAFRLGDGISDKRFRRQIPSAFGDSAFIVDKTSVVLNNTTGLSASDGEAWNGTLAAAYPDGYEPFYTMKYELSQEQYVSFLNKLNLPQQRARTVGAKLDGYQPGEYLFGSNRKAPSYRNGIVVTGRENNQAGAPFTFGNNLTNDKNYNSYNDGQCVACNYLSIEDMLAYADWCGLRPLSEMEYEKMARKPFPAQPVQGVYAWGNNTVSPATGKTDFNTPQELLNGNVNNAEAAIGGPVRVGAFTREEVTLESGGISWWGVAELSGNLAEIYYNAGQQGRLFQAVKAAHGDGMLNEYAAANVVAAYWPRSQVAFGVRGGSFRSAAGELAVSDRSKALNYFSGLNFRDSTVGVRLGRTVEQKTTLTNVLTLENGLKTNANVIYDTVCASSPYRIAGNMPEYETWQVLWYRSMDEGRNWEIIEDEHDTDLVLSGWDELLPQENVRRVFYFRRKLVTLQGDAVSGDVIIIAGRGYTLNILSDTLKLNGTVTDIKLTTPLPATIEWRLAANNKLIKTDRGSVSVYHPVIADFIDGDRRNTGRNYWINVNVDMSGGCRSQKQVQVFVEELKK